MDFNYYMMEALKEANKALLKGEVPIGSIVVLNGEIIGRGHNNVETSKHSFEHAEILAIKNAQDKIGDWRLNGAYLFTTLEPCITCSGAIVQARIDTLVYGASDMKRGFAGSVLNIVNDDIFNHRVKVKKGILEEDCKDILLKFFRKRREENKK